MALAEARAAWQRTANRCLVQEDAKRAPKLACCSSNSMPPSAKQPDNTEPTNTAGGHDIPTTGSEPPLNRCPSYPNLSPNSRWWLQLQPNYGFQKSLINEQLNSSEMETYQMTCFNSNVIDNTKSNENGLVVGYEVEKNTNELYFDSESSWIRSEKNVPWWRTADTEELASIVAQRSNDLIENCDLPRPQNTRIKKDLNVNVPGYGRDKFLQSSLNSKLGSGKPEDINAHVSTTEGDVCPKLKLMSAELLSPRPERMPKTSTFEKDPSKAELLEALRHSQTRAREAEKAAKQACAEKEHVVKLVFRQASQLFAYKQWVQLLQLENIMYFQFKDNVNIVPIALPWTPQKSGKSGKKPAGKKQRAKRGRHWFDVGKDAVVFALGLGLVGAGLLLGWTVGWMLW